MFEVWCPHRLCVRRCVLGFLFWEVAYVENSRDSRNFDSVLRYHVHPFFKLCRCLMGNENTRSKFVFRLHKLAMMRTIFKKHSRYSYKPLLKEHYILTFPWIYIHRVMLCVHKNLYIFQNYSFVVITVRIYVLRNKQPKDSYS